MLQMALLPFQTFEHQTSGFQQHSPEMHGSVLNIKTSFSILIFISLGATLGWKWKSHLFTPVGMQDWALRSLLLVEIIMHLIHSKVINGNMQLMILEPQPRLFILVIMHSQVHCLAIVLLVMRQNFLPEK